MNFSRKSILTLSAAIILAGAIIVGGIYGPTAWKVFRGQTAAPEDSVVIQTPPVNYVEEETAGEEAPAKEESTPAEPTTASNNNNSNNNQNAASPPGIVKYREPDLSLLNLAPSIEDYFGESGLSDAAKTLAFGTAWNIHQYVDGYLFGITAGPQMNEEDIKKYIIFHRTLWEKQMENEANLKNAATFDVYMRNLLNRGIDAFDNKDKVRIEQFHQEIHDMDTHLFRDDQSSKVYGATPFSTKRSD